MLRNTWSNKPLHDALTSSDNCRHKNQVRRIGVITNDTGAGIEDSRLGHVEIFADSFGGVAVWSCDVRDQSRATKFTIDMDSRAARRCRRSRFSYSTCLATRAVGMVVHSDSYAAHQWRASARSNTSSGTAPIRYKIATRTSAMALGAKAKATRAVGKAQRALGKTISRS